MAFVVAERLPLDVSVGLGRTSPQIFGPLGEGAEITSYVGSYRSDTEKYLSARCRMPRTLVEAY